MYVASSFYVRKEWIYPGTWFWRAARRPVRGAIDEGDIRRYEGEPRKAVSAGMRGKEFSNRKKLLTFD